MTLSESEHDWQLEVEVEITHETFAKHNSSEKSVLVSMRLPITFLKASVRGHGSDGHLDVVQQDKQVLLQLTDSPPERQEADPASSQIFVDRLFGSSSCIFVAETVKHDGTRNVKLRNSHYWISVTFFPQENLVTFLLASLRIFGRLWGSMQIFPMIDSTGVTPWNCCCQWFFPCWALRRQVGVKWIWNRILPTFFFAEVVKNMSYMYTCSFFFCKIWLLIAITVFLGSDPSTSELWMLMTYGVIEMGAWCKVPWMDLHIPYNDLLGQRRGSRAFGCVYFSWRTSFASANKNPSRSLWSFVHLKNQSLIHSINPSECQVKDVLQEAGKRDDCFGLTCFEYNHHLKKNTRNRGKKWASETCKLSDFRSKKANCGLQVRSTRPCLPWFLAQPWMNLQNPWRSCTYSNVVYMDDDWCWQTYLQIPRFAWPFLKACILWVVLNCETCTRCAGWHTILYISLVTKIALLAISTLETWVLWMTLAVASLNCCWMTLNDSTWGGP